MCTTMLRIETESSDRGNKNTVSTWSVNYKKPVLFLLLLLFLLEVVIVVLLVVL